MNRGSIQRGIAIASLAVTIAACSETPTTTPDPEPGRYVVPGDTTFPEGIATDRTAGVYFVGSTTTGAIYRGLFDDSVATLFTQPGADGRTSVLGITLDNGGRLFAAGGGTGTVWVIDRGTGGTIAQLSTGAPAGGSIVNDVTATSNGVVFATDSREPVIYRVRQSITGTFEIERWLPLAGTPIVYAEGFNLNGIVATADNRYLLTIQSNTGRLFRVTIADSAIVPVAIPAADSLTSGDGLVLDGRTLYVVRNAARQIVTLQMSADYASATRMATIVDASFAFPTTAALDGDDLLVVNGQLDRRATKTHTLPFTITRVAR